MKGKIRAGKSIESQVTNENIIPRHHLHIPLRSIDDLLFERSIEVAAKKCTLRLNWKI